MGTKVKAAGRWLMARIQAQPWIAYGLLAVMGIAGVGFVLRNGQRGTWVRPQVGPIVEAIYSLGTVKAVRTWQLKTGIPVGITDIGVREGDLVSAGQRVLSTDSGTFFAPFRGTVTKVNAHKGEILMPGTPALQLTDLNERYILVSLDQPSALRVRQNQKAEISVESIRGRKLVGRVISIYPSDSQFLVRLQVDSMPPEILPDMTADVAIEVERREKALLVPLIAVRRGQIIVRRAGKRRQPVHAKVGAVNAESAEILDGSVLPSDEVLIPGR